ncbi:MAG: HNH endonuclease [bacterium]|nr:HNH endonuclease [bacterium]
MNCAICNRKVIRLDSLAKTFSEIAKPLSEMIRKGFMEQWKEKPNLWNILNQLSKQYPNDSLDTILQSDEQNYQKVRNLFSKEAINKSDNNYDTERFAKHSFKKMLFDSRKELLSANMIMNNCNKFKKYLDGSPLRAYEQLDVYAKKYPDKTLSEIIQMDEIYNANKANDESASKNFYNKLNYHFDKILKIISPENRKDFLYFMSIEMKAKNIIYTEKNNNTIILKIKKLYDEALKSEPYQDIKSMVMEELEQINAEYPTEYDFFITAHDDNWSDAEILNNIIGAFGSTGSRIIPLSRGGKDNVYNTIIMCKMCNSAKGNQKCDDEYIKFHPEVNGYIQKQIDSIMTRILNGQIKDEALVRWPIIVAGKLNSYTNGAINPNIGDYMINITKLTEDKIKKNLLKIKKLEMQNLKIAQQSHCEDNKIILNNELQIKELKAFITKNQKDLKFFESYTPDDEINNVSSEYENILEKHEDFSDDFGGNCG